MQMASLVRRSLCKCAPSFAYAEPVVVVVVVVVAVEAVAVEAPSCCRLVPFLKTENFAEKPKSINHRQPNGAQPENVKKE